MFTQIIIAIVVIWAIAMFGTRIVGIINKTLGMAERGVSVADKYVEEWETDVQQRIDTKAQLNAEAREEELNSLNELRTKAGKHALKVND